MYLHLYLLYSPERHKKDKYLSNRNDRGSGRAPLKKSSGQKNSPAPISTK